DDAPQVIDRGLRCLTLFEDVLDLAKSEARGRVIGPLQCLSDVVLSNDNVHAKYGSFVGQVSCRSTFGQEEVVNVLKGSLDYKIGPHDCLRCLLHSGFGMLTMTTVEGEYFRNSCHIRDRAHQLHWLPTVGAQERFGMIVTRH